VEYLETRKLYVCSKCGIHHSARNQLISKTFSGRHGRAFLFHKVVNFQHGEPEERMLMTGLHVVRDIFCKSCKNYIGWKYDRAYEIDQKYKEGKFILERNQVDKSEWHD